MTSLNHTTAREYIQQLADGEALRAEARQALHQHLAECVECRKYAQEIKALHQSLSRTLRARWEHQPLPSRPRPLITRPPARPWSPLAQLMVMLTMTIMVLSLLPEWGRWPTAPQRPVLTPLGGAQAAETRRAPATIYHAIEAIPDDDLESLTSEAANGAPEQLETPIEAIPDDDLESLTSEAANGAPEQLETPIEAIPDDDLESLTRQEANQAPEQLDSNEPSETYPSYLNNSDNRASRSQ